jgi:hypothetical protein
MDITTLTTIAESKFKHALYRKNLQERIEAQLAVAHNGGLFKASQTLISFLYSWDTENIILEDEYHNPIKCDRLKLLASLKEAYQFALNSWHVDFENSKKIRNVSQL